MSKPQLLLRLAMTDSTPVPPENKAALQEWRNRYESLGMVTIPLTGKSPYDPVSWKTTPAKEQWSRAGSEFHGNIGLVLGNEYAVIDADDHQTACTIENGLASLVLNPPTVSSPHGKHFYIRLADAPFEFNSARLLPGVYSGELRVRNCYVVAPGSQVDGVAYWWSKSSPEDLKFLPVVQWKDLLWLLPDQQALSLIEALPVQLLLRDLPVKARDLLDELRGASKGQHIQKYRSRSEAEAAVMAMLIFAGWSYDSILATFQRSVPGKFNECKDQQHYFDRTYFRVLSKIAAHPIRQEIATVWQTVNVDPYWPGANGYLQRDTYLGLLSKGWQYGSWTVSASERELAEYASARQPGIHNALKALSSEGLVQKLSSNRVLGLGTTWKINPVEDVSSLIMSNDSDSTVLPSEITELWSPAMLGRTAGTVYRLLCSEPASVRKLSKITGKARSTIQLALENHLGTCDLAKKVPGGWIRGTAALAKVAEEFETRKARDARHYLHKQEREMFAEFRVRHKKYDKKT